MKPQGIRQREIGLAFLAIAVLLSPMAKADAADIQMDTLPTLRLEEGWHSNVYNQSDEEVSSFGTRVSPGLAVIFTAPDEVTLRFSGNYERTWFHDSEAKDADDSTWSFRVESSGAWKISPTFSVRPSVYYLSTPDSYRRVQLLPSGDPLVPPVSITNYGTATTHEFGGGLAFEYLASPSMTIGITGNYSQQRFPDDNAAGADLTDASQYGGGLTVLYLVTPRTKVGVTGSASHQTYDNNVSTDTYSAGIQFGYQFTQVLRFDATAGGSQIRQKEDVATASDGEKKTTPSGSFNFSYISDTYLAQLYGSAVYSGGSGFGEATRQGTVGIIFTNKLSREWSWNLNGAYQTSKSVFSDDAVEIRTVYGKAGIQYQPWEWVTFDAYGSLNRQKSDGLFGDTINSYSAVLGVTIGKAYNVF